eukprot:990117-Alexandrium_andersonii.AAC.1
MNLCGGAMKVGLGQRGLAAQRAAREASDPDDHARPFKIVVRSSTCVGQQSAAERSGVEGHLSLIHI